MLLNDRFNKIPFHENNNKKIVWEEDDPTKLSCQMNLSLQPTQSLNIDSKFSLFLQCFSALARKQ